MTYSRVFENAATGKPNAEPRAAFYRTQPKPGL